MSSFDVDTVFHAAAYKHVPLVEQNIVEGVQNNIMGTQTVVKAAIDAKVETFTLISTDKAVRPTISWAQQNELPNLYVRHMRPTSRPPAFQFVRLEMCFGHLDPSFHVSRNRLSMVGQ